MGKNTLVMKQTMDCITILCLCLITSPSNASGRGQSIGILAYYANDRQDSGVALAGLPPTAPLRLGGPPYSLLDKLFSGTLFCELIGDWDSLVKRYPEPMAHGPDACEPSHPLWPMAWRPVSRHTHAEAVDTGCQRDIPVL